MKNFKFNLIDGWQKIGGAVFVILIFLVPASRSILAQFSTSNTTNITNYNQSGSYNTNSIADSQPTASPKNVNQPSISLSGNSHSSNHGPKKNKPKAH